jgi:uncharacterized membrane protein YdjX (TVP38/TMEM64 family)
VSWGSEIVREDETTSSFKTDGRLPFMTRAHAAKIVLSLVALVSAAEIDLRTACGRPCNTRSFGSPVHPPALVRQQQQQQQRRQRPPATSLYAGMHPAGRVGALALASEVLQVVNTFVFMLVLTHTTGATSPAALVEIFAGFFHRLGLWAYPAYSALLLFITVLPLMSAILFIILAGMCFGTVRGTVLVSLSLSSAAAISADVSRRIARSRGFGLANIDRGAAAVDAAIARGPRRTALLLVTLLRLSPVLPFTFSNYMAGLTSLPLWIIFTGTALGTLPTQAVYVGAGALGKQALEGGIKMPKSILALGALATVVAILLIGHVSQHVLSGMELEKQADVPGVKGA